MLALIRVNGSDGQPFVFEFAIPRSEQQVMSFAAGKRYSVNGVII